ncbi:hypothetical protein ES705_15962 [subsurface metagenome]
MNYRCINNPMGYCSSKPNVPSDVEVYHYPGPDGKDAMVLYQAGTCVNNWHTCSQFKTWKEESQRYISTGAAGSSS